MGFIVWLNKKTCIFFLVSHSCCALNATRVRGYGEGVNRACFLFRILRGFKNFDFRGTVAMNLFFLLRFSHRVHAVRFSESYTTRNNKEILIL